MSLPARILRAVKRINLASEPTLRHAWVYFQDDFIRIRRRLRTMNSENHTRRPSCTTGDRYDANNR